MATKKDETEVNAIFATATMAASNNKDIYLEKKDSPKGSWDVANAASLSLNWNKLFPFQLVIMERKEGIWSIAKSPSPFTLPIGPQSLSIDMAFAFQVEATQGGIIEQSNGAPFRDIVLQGTTGVLPLRGTVEKPASFNVAQGIFAGTVNASQAFASQAAQSLNLAQPQNIIPEADFDKNSGGFSIGESTGYFQFLLLKRYLEWYANVKKTSAGVNLCLGLAVWKEKEIYLVTPNKFTVSRSAQAGLTYNYTLAMRAWKRVVNQTAVGGVQVPHTFPGRDANSYAKVINGIENARRVLENGRNILQAIRADVNNLVFGNIRRVTLFAKDVLGTSAAATDFPASLVEDFKNGILELQNLPDIIGPNPLPQTAQLMKDIDALSSSSQKSKTGGGSSAVGQLKQSLANNQGSSPALDAFVKPENYYDFWSRIPVDTLNLRPETVRRLEKEKESIRDLRREDFERMRDDIAAVLADFESSVGVGNSTYNSVYGDTNRTPVRAEPSDNDWDIIFSLGETMRQLEAMAASSSINRVQNNTPSDFVAGLAQRSGIAYSVPTSKYLVPFPYGYTLEQLSSKYLGTPDRWIEIATLNGLKSPYVDETGFTQDFVTNGSGNKFSVTDASRYYVDQSVWLSALGVKREKRHITKIEKLSPTLAIITVDGEADLSRFKTSLEAFVQAFTPETVNSLQYIYIPSDEQVENDWLTKSIPGIDDFDPLFRVGGADLLLDNNGDLVITRDGTTRLAVGLTNLIQRLRIGLATPQGSLARHPEFGFGIIAGTSTADLSAKSVLAAAKSFVQNEDGFSGVTSASVYKNGNSMSISLAVQVAGTGKTVPITVELK